MMKNFNFINFQLYKLLTVVCFQLLTFNCFAQAPNQPGAGNCLSFNGTSDYVGDIGTNTSFSFIQNAGVFTIESWIKPGSFSNKEYMIVSNTPTSLENGFVFDLVVTGGLTYLNLPILNGSGFLINSSTPAGIIQDSLWHYVAAVGNGTNITFYVDGIAFAGNGTMGVFATGPSSRLLQIGDSYSSIFVSPGAMNFNGQIDEVRIWNKALTQNEIRDNMCKKLTGNESGLVGYWRFDEITGNIAFDSSPNGNNGTGF